MPETYHLNYNYFPMYKERAHIHKHIFSAKKLEKAVIGKGQLVYCIIFCTCTMQLHTSIADPSCHFDADSDPTFHFDSDPDADPGF